MAISSAMACQEGLAGRDRLVAVQRVEVERCVYNVLVLLTLPVHFGSLASPTHLLVWNELNNCFYL